MLRSICQTFFSLFLVSLAVVFCSVCVVSQEPTDKEVRAVPPEIKARIELYFKLYKNEDWENLYEIDDWEIRNKEDYVNIHAKEKTNPYRRFRSVLEIGLENTMHYWASSKKWQIYGCTRLIDKEGMEILAKGSVYVENDESRGWVVGDSTVSYFGDGFHACEKPLSQLPINIRMTR